MISEREKYSVAYMLPAAAAGLVCGGTVRGLAAVAPESADAGRTAAPAPGGPIVLAAAQAAAASSSNGRRPCRNKDVIVSPERSEAG